MRAGNREHHCASFTLRHVLPSMTFGTRTVWSSRTKIAASDTHRIIADILVDPALGVGILQFDDCLASCFRCNDHGDEMLIAYADQIGNGAMLKQPGFLADCRTGSPGQVDGRIPGAAVEEECKA